MPRAEFSKATKRDALKRSEKRCEAVGMVYGLVAGVRCNAPLDRGVEFDHYPLPATDEGSDTLDNCVACCRDCHGFKTRTYDVPMQAKNKRVSDKHLGIVAPKRKLSGPGFPKSEPQHSATKLPTKRVGYFPESNDAQ